jgi:hypothetical protein
MTSFKFFTLSPKLEDKYTIQRALFMSGGMTEMTEDLLWKNL